MRRLRKGLADQEMGFVRIAVQAYIHLLVSSTNEDSKFTFNYLTKELIQPPDAVVRPINWTFGRVHNDKNVQASNRHCAVIALSVQANLH